MTKSLFPPMDEQLNLSHFRVRSVIGIKYFKAKKLLIDPFAQRVWFESVKNHTLNTFIMGSCQMCSWGKPRVFREHAPRAPHFSQLWHQASLK